ncbi:MAG: hypothetical protein KDC05_17440 [Bacteroidales bacterium]|nr:hypothetical protein [Bacteroidales bacterium]
MKKVMKISLWILLFAALFVLVGFIETEHKKTTCKGIEVYIDYNGTAPLISESEILNPILKTFDSLTGKKLSDINSIEIENLVNSIDFVENAEVYSTLTGILKVKASQRIPVLRVVNNRGQNFYIDRNGRLFPVKTGLSTRILVASGNIKTTYSDTLNIINSESGVELLNLMKLAQYIENDEFLRAQIEQVYVTGSGEYEMVPKVGRQLIEFGDITSMEKKFENLKVFYKDGMKRAGWDAYKTINLKFDNQVVCEKK